MRSRRFAGAGAIALACALLCAPLAARAQTTSSLTASIREISFDSSGNTRIIVSVAGNALPSGTTLGSDAFSVTESGKQVQNLSVQPIAQSTAAPVAVALVFDTSGSTAGAAISAAKNAAKDFVSALPGNIRVALISFSDNVHVVRDFTTDHGLINNAINGFSAGGGTALYDAVLSANVLLDRQGGQKNLVLFTDGHDDGSRATLAQAVAALHNSGTAATTVLLGTAVSDYRVLQQLTAASKGGFALRVSNLTALHDAFTQAAQSLTSQYVLTYAATDTTTKELNISVAATAGGFTATDSSVVVNARVKAQPSATAPAGPPPASKPLVSAFASRTGLYLGIGAAFLGILFFIGMLLYAPAGKASERALQRRLRLYTKGGQRKEKKETSGTFLGGTALGRGAVSFVERLPRSKNYDEKMQIDLEKAGWPLRSSEFVIIQVGGFIAGMLIGWALLQRLWLGLILGVLGVVIPRVFLSVTINRRTATFLAQLPDTLQLLAGSLQAGYGFLQALDTIAKETVAPTSTEFARVLSEARLGRPIDEALDSMAERVGGEDFKWVVLAINIQRQVGGNLAQLLTTVANTLREREAVRRQIKVLSAEGRLSAYILVALPFVLFGYLSIINPEYIHQLTQETIGKIMMIGALILIGVGAVWMRKLVNIDV